MCNKIIQQYHVRGHVHAHLGQLSSPLQAEIAKYFVLIN